jgi:glycosyltransferase involved in cell wall biosynthesis
VADALAIAATGDADPHDAYVEISDRERLVGAPVVSVIMLAYNHGPWIAEAIESVVSQACPFEYELLIGEDGSADDTRAVAIDYQRRFPHRIRVVHPLNNMGAYANHRRLSRLARGEFVAYCEGDDYWCRRDKLAAQVSLLRNNPSAAMVHTDWVRAKWRGDRWTVDWRHSMHRRLPMSRLQGALFGVFYFSKILRTCTVMHRRDALRSFNESALAKPRYRFADTVKAAYFTANWRVEYWPCVSAVYRESPKSALRSGTRSFADFLRSALEFDTAARAYFRDRDDYPQSYRFECDAGLLVLGLRMRDRAVVLEALRDLFSHFTIAEIFGAAFRAVRMRLPTGSARASAFAEHMGDGR